MLLAIGLQESRFLHRAQIGGPARGYWQFERGGVHGVLSHHASKAEAGKLCAALDYAPSEDIVYGRSEEHTSELQSLMRSSYAVFCLKKKKNKTNRHITSNSPIVPEIQR